MTNKSTESKLCTMPEEDDNNQQPQTALQDLIAGGVAGSVSVIVGHPFDTYKVRLQTSTTSTPTNAAAFGGISSLFRGMAPPLSTAAVVNALIFSSYGESSRIWDDVFTTKKNDDSDDKSHDNVSQNQSTWIKSFACGSFAGAVQALVICPSEHIKCRLQIQHGIGCKDHIFKGPFDAFDKIINSHGVTGLYRGFACTAWREIPAFGLYFATYDFIKEQVTSLISSKKDDSQLESSNEWAVSALAGGCSGALTWVAIYPFDVIKTKIQTAPLDTPLEKRRIIHMFQKNKRENGMKFFFRGLGVTLLRAFPVNAIIFPVYEFTLFELSRRGIGNFKANDYIDSAV